MPSSWITENLVQLSRQTNDPAKFVWVQIPVQLCKLFQRLRFALSHGAEQSGYNIVLTHESYSFTEQSALERWWHEQL